MATKVSDQKPTIVHCASSGGLHWSDEVCQAEIREWN